jgi:hypothetical protein
VIATVLHPFASVIVQVYDPAARFDALAPVPPDGAHEYVYPGVPPDGDAVAVPVLAEHPVGVLVALAVNAEGAVMLNVFVSVHPFASVIVQV